MQIIVASKLLYERGISRLTCNLTTKWTAKYYMSATKRQFILLPDAGYGGRGTSRLKPASRSYSVQTSQSTLKVANKPTKNITGLKRLITLAKPESKRLTCK